MGTIAHFADLRAGIVEALRELAQSSAGQHVIRIGTDACEVNWDPDAYRHQALLLPLVLLPAAVDEEAARARWRDVSLAEAVSQAYRLDLREKAMLRHLARLKLH